MLGKVRYRWWIAIACLSAGASAAAAPAAALATRTTSAPTVGECTSASVRLYDTLVGQPVNNVVCFSGVGTADLSSCPRGSGGSWAGAVRSFVAGSGPGLLAHSVCTTVACPSQSFSPGLPAQQTNTDAAGQTADQLVLYALKPPIDTWESIPLVHHFAVSDVGLGNPGCDPSCSTVLAKAPSRDFIWSGDLHTPSWNVGNPDMIVGHYVPFNGFDSGELSRCLPGTTNDCNAVSGWECVPVPQDASGHADPQNRRLQYWAGESVCVLLGAPGLACASNADCGPKPCVCNYASDGAGHCLPDPSRPGAALGFCTGGCTSSADCGAGACSCIAGPDATGTGCAPNPDPTHAPGICLMTVQNTQKAEFDFWRATHPDWILYRSGDKSPHYPRDPTIAPDPDDVTAVAWYGGAQIPVDFTSEVVVEEMLRRIRLWESFDGPGYTAAYSALSADVVFPANYFGAVGAFRGGIWTPLFSGNQKFDPADRACVRARGYCDSAWRDAVLTWLRRLADEMHRDGLRLVVNLGYSGSISPYKPIAPRDPTLQAIYHIVDGVFDEGGFSRGGHGRQAPPPADSCDSYSYDGRYTCTAIGWSNLRLSLFGNFDASAPLGYLQSVQALGKPYYNKTSFPLLAGTNDLDPAQIEWALASNRLAEDHYLSIYVNPNYGGGGDNGATEDYPQLSVPIGHPCARNRRAGQTTYFRKFSHGFVVVNAGPNTAKAVTVRLPTGARFFAWSNPASSLVGSYALEVPSPIRVPYQTGRVLYTPSSLCP